MIFFKTDEEIELLRESNQLLSKTLGHISGLLKVGITGNSIDKVAEEFIRDHGGIPGFKGYKGFPATLCVSKNGAVVHGIPNDEAFQSTDIISVDCGVLLNGFYGDCAYTFAFKEVGQEVLALMKVTKKALYLGIDKCVPGNRVGDISHAIQHFCEREHPYGIVRELVGHGVGRNLHEDPDVPNFGSKGRGPLLRSGMVVAIEPMVNLGDRRVKQGNDGWTIFTKDGKPSVHFEHSVAVREQGFDILSDHSYIENSIKNNTEIHDI
ncbi:MAG: type I methionyl aminopeptidase [Saprospiraceae bacterium]